MVVPFPPESSARYFGYFSGSMLSSGGAEIISFQYGVLDPKNLDSKPTSGGSISLTLVSLRCPGETLEGGTWNSSSSHSSFGYSSSVENTVFTKGNFFGSSSACSA